MWPKSYRDYKPDEPLIKNQVEPGHGIAGGVEMHEINGWGNLLHIPQKRKNGFIGALLNALFSKFSHHQDSAP